jgi:cyclase
MSKGLSVLVAALTWVAAGATWAAEDAPAAPPLQIVAVAPGIHMLVGRGGNIGVASGPDKTFVIDDEYGNLSAEVVAAIASITDRPASFVFNTHWHEDHTGGNEYFGNAGTLIVAQDNVRLRLSKAQLIAFFEVRSEAQPPAALPIVTFAESITFYLNGDEIYAFHVPNAHTDGDAIVHFRKADVIHAGDTFFNGLYPFIDYDTGGSIEGMIAAADRMLALAGPHTKIIPGHGPVGDREQLQDYRTMLETVRGRLRTAIADGKALGEVIAMHPSADFDTTWGGGFMSPDRWVEMLYRGMLTDAKGM